MADTVKKQFRLDTDALAILNERAKSENKRGQWISQAIREYHELLTIRNDQQECGTLEEIAATLMRVERRLIRVESKVGV